MMNPIGDSYTEPKSFGEEKDATGAPDRSHSGMTGFVGELDKAAGELFARHQREPGLDPGLPEERDARSKHDRVYRYDKLIDEPLPHKQVY